MYFKSPFPSEALQFLTIIFFVIALDPQQYAIIKLNIMII